MPKYNLTTLQKNELIAQYVQLCVDSMDMECLLTIAEDHVTDYCEKLSDSELKAEIDDHDDELFDELVDNVTQQYPKQDVNNSTHTYSLNVNESISFPCSS